MIRTLLDWAAVAYIIILIVRWAVEAFFHQHQNTGWFLKIKDLTEPLLDVIRKMVPPYKGVDFSYIIAIFAVRVISWIVIKIL